jgi:hypothetical protein
LENSVSSILELTAADGKNYQTKFYNLDAILSVGYRVNSINATIFRKWANSVLKEYILRGYAISQRFERLEYRVAETEKKIDFFVRTSLPPVEGVFYDGQIFDAYKFVAEKSEPRFYYDLKDYCDYFAQYNPVNHINPKNQSSDNIGASLKDLGKKLFAFSKMEMTTGELFCARLLK